MERGKAPLCPFQFHKGTIKTLNPDYFSDGWLKFQFHKGTIKTSLEKEPLKEEIDFNSIKVRLKLSSPKGLVQVP